VPIARFCGEIIVAMTPPEERALANRMFPCTRLKQAARAVRHQKYWAAESTTWFDAATAHVYRFRPGRLLTRCPVVLGRTEHGKQGQNFIEAVEDRWQVTLVEAVDLEEESVAVARMIGQFTRHTQLA